MDNFPPNGFNRADGLNGFSGTPTPEGSRIVKPSTAIFEEMADSPEIERGEQGTIVHRYKCDYQTAKDIIVGNGRGTMLEDSYGNITKVLSSKLEYQKGDYCIVSITAESVSFDLPPDEFDVSDAEFNPPLYQHPRYKELREYEPATGMTGIEIINAIQNAINLPQALAQQENAARLEEIEDEDVFAQAYELLSKMRKGIDTFYLSGYKVVWSKYYFEPVALNPGGYIEDPVSTGALDDYFCKDGSGENIFTFLAGTVNPNVYGDGISWLRQADNLSYSRTFFKLTMSWVGGPIGQWDADLYEPDALPPGELP